MSRATPQQLTALAVLFAAHGVTERRDRIRLCADHARRHLNSSSELTATEAAQLAHRLEHLVPRDGSLHRVLHRLRLADEQTARGQAGVIVCGPGQPTEQDQVLIDGFADALAADRVAEWAGEQP